MNQNTIHEFFDMFNLAEINEDWGVCIEIASLLIDLVAEEDGVDNENYLTTLIMLAEVHMRVEDYDQARIFCEKALRLTKKLSGPYRKQYIDLLMLCGNICDGQDDTDSSPRYANEALDIGLEILQLNHYLIPALFRNASLPALPPDSRNNDSWNEKLAIKMIDQIEGRVDGRRGQIEMLKYVLMDALDEDELSFAYHIARHYLQWCHDFFGAQHLQTAKAFHYQAVTLYNVGNSRTAYEFLQKELSIRSRCQGFDVEGVGVCKELIKNIETEAMIRQFLDERSNKDDQE